MSKTPIMGKAIATAEQMATYLLSVNHTPKINMDPVAFCRLFLYMGALEGVRGDVLFAQSCKETGNFKYTGTVKENQNNYAGLGTTDVNTPGATFPDEATGILGQAQHAKAYASTESLVYTCVDPRYHLVKKGCAPNWEDLGGKWAVPGYDVKKYSSLDEANKAEDSYGYQIMNIYRKIVGEIIEVKKEETESEGLPMNVYRKGVKVQLSKNFKSTEFDCNGKGCCSQTPIDPKLVEVLQNIRDHFGVPVNLNCGYRCPDHNAKVSGASKNSKHMKGIAADIVVKGVHPYRVARYIETIPGFAGRIGCYTWNAKGSGFVHVDVRGTNSRGIYTENNTKYDSLSTFSKTIKRGAKGRHVIVVQRLLADVGIYTSNINGSCDEKTEAAIIKWNEMFCRYDDKSWGPKCWSEAFPI